MSTRSSESLSIMTVCSQLLGCGSSREWFMVLFTQGFVCQTGGRFLYLIGFYTEWCTSAKGGGRVEGWYRGRDVRQRCRGGELKGTTRPWEVSWSSLTSWFDVLTSSSVTLSWWGSRSILTSNMKQLLIPEITAAWNNKKLNQPPMKPAGAFLSICLNAYYLFARNNTSIQKMNPLRPDLTYAYFTPFRTMYNVLPASPFRAGWDLCMFHMKLLF